MTSSLSNGKRRILETKTKDGVKFGRELREKDFLFDKTYLPMNHGSYGTYPSAVRQKMRALQDASEARPDDFVRYKYPILVDESREAMAKLLNTPSSTLVFVPNATTGVNIVLRNLTFQPGDHILYFATIYGACEKTVVYITETTPAKAVKIAYTCPVEDDWLVEEFKKKVEEVEGKGGKVKIAIFDTITSMPGIRLPFERLTATCKELGVLSCIDGAHGVGNISLDLGKLDPDFFVSNCHKWLYVPRACAIFHVATRNQYLIRSTLPTSHGFQPRDAHINTPFAMIEAGKSNFVGNFQFASTIDYTQYLCVPAALKWRESIGGEEVIMKYCSTLAQEGAKLVAGVLGTVVMENTTQTLGRCTMSNVRLPISLAKAEGAAGKNGMEKGEVAPAIREWMSSTLLNEYGTFIQSYFHGGNFWARFSGQVYLEMSDFEGVAKMLKEVCEKIERGDWMAGRSKL